jgi:hypothetical protein
LIADYGRELWENISRSLDYTDLGRGLHGFPDVLEISDYMAEQPITQMRKECKQFFRALHLSLRQTPKRLTPSLSPMGRGEKGGIVSASTRKYFTFRRPI